VATRLLTLFSVLLLVAFSAVSQEELVLVGRVTKVLDGDTIRVQLDSGPVAVRFDSIDAPERKQPWGPEATAALSQRVADREVELSVTEQDRYERLVATVYVGGENINAWLVTQGHAWSYRAYLNDKDMVALEDRARSARRGLWDLERPIAPWDWRRGHRAASEDFDDRDDFEPRGTDADRPTFECGTKRVCGDMSTCEEAQFFFKHCGLSNLDGNDNDGKPCESLCR